MSFFTVLIVAISLSMDAFSLSLIYGTLSIPSQMIRIVSTTVGVFHFFMPLFGYLFGEVLSSFLVFNANSLVGIIFVFLSIQMFLSVFKEESAQMFNGFLSYLLFGFTVSIDSFSVGIGIGSLGEFILYPCIIFSVTSFIFTYLGLKMGKKLALKFGKISTVLGSIILFVLGINYLIFS